MTSPAEPPPSEPDVVSQRLRAIQERRAQGLLPEIELFWRDHYSWLKDSGYLLRPRYSPDRIAPGRKGGIKPEDDIKPAFSVVADATRISDESLVLIKKCESDESEILRRLSSDPLASDPKNRCIKLSEVLSVPDDPKLELIVMPFYYDWDFVPFLTVGEAVEFFSQIFEGLQFLHNNHFWHGDVKLNNILMDASPLLTEKIHPWEPTMTPDLSRSARFRNRLQHPVKYYLIDFDLSGIHDPSEGPPLVAPGYGGTRGVPEFAQKDKLCDPFAVDVYCLGNMIAEYFTEGEDDKFGQVRKRGFRFMEELVADMMNKDPTKRPSMDEVVRRFSEIKASLTGRKLRSRVARIDEHPVARILKFIPHWSRQLYYTVWRIPAIPTP